MSVPARSLSAATRPKPKTKPPAARPPISPSPYPRRRARRGTPAFWVLTAAVITALVVGIVSLSALAVQASFRSDDLTARLGVLTQQQQVLREQVAAASAPSRVMRWARGEGMVMPERVVILRIPNVVPGSGA
jgi:cell division protein FtsL